jgi:hypothetical protein
MDRGSWFYCLGALAASLAVCAAGFSFAAMPRDALEAAKRPAPAETLPDIDLGGGFGKVSVVELVGYYIENPPAPAGAAGGAVPAAKRFGGC